MTNMKVSVKDKAILESKEKTYNFYLSKVLENLHICLIFSPVGDKLRTRLRKVIKIIKY